MSEYGKSTPKYWCKFCSTYVRDTPLERRNHEATGKHQGSVQRSLRTIHKEHEKEEREKSRAKAEVERLNGVVAGKPVASRDTGVRVGQGERAVREQKPVSVEERKRQMAQLAGMGVQIPDQFRGSMAMTGEWQTVSTRVVDDREVDKKPDVGALNVGVRKRKMDENEEEEEAVGSVTKRKGWGKDLREYPGQIDAAGEADIEALLKGGNEMQPKAEDAAENSPPIKQEESADQDASIDVATSTVADVPIKDEDSVPGPVVFKKRKAKVART